MQSVTFQFTHICKSTYNEQMHDAFGGVMLYTHRNGIITVVPDCDVYYQ